MDFEERNSVPNSTSSTVGAGGECPGQSVSPRTLGTSRILEGVLCGDREEGRVEETGANFEVVSQGDFGPSPGQSWARISLLSPRFWTSRFTFSEWSAQLALGSHPRSFRSTSSGIFLPAGSAQWSPAGHQALPGLFAFPAPTAPLFRPPTRST